MKFAFLTLLFLTQTVLAGVYTENTWKNPQIIVCFADAEEDIRVENGFKIKVKNWSKSNRKNVQKWVNEEYSEARTGIYFTGFKSCSQETEADVILFYNSNSYIKRFVLGDIDGVAGDLGPRKNDKVDGFPGARSLVAISKTGMNKGTVIHEFGHVAGLAHEHNHYDAPKDDKSCPHYERSFSTKLEYTDFDPASIMSYCSIKLKKLSNGDVSLLKEMYPN
ncbi:MAG: M12 family metallo-peptidase [Bdellovibrionota bacterium]